MPRSLRKKLFRELDAEHKNNKQVECLLFSCSVFVDDAFSLKFFKRKNFLPSALMPLNNILVEVEPTCIFILQFR